MKVIMTLVLVGCVLAGCNTVAGVGEDISGTARWFQQGLPRSY